MSGSALPFLTLAWPLALALIVALPPLRRHSLALLPLAPLPGLWLGLTGDGERTELPGLLLGVELAAMPAGGLMLASTAALWFLAALYAQGYMAGTRKPAVFSAFWCVTLTGNLGVFLAADVVTFYVAFAAVSLAAYVLVVHEGTEAALRAGRVYVVMVILGEVCLLSAFVIGISAAGSLAIAEIRAVLPEVPLGGLATLLLIGGFGIKAGLMPLHVWLPLAHPAAPTPASAVLSGAIVKAGIVGLILFLPDGAGPQDWLLPLGMAGAFAGALLGLTRSDPKAILAYSTISQMSLLAALIRAGIGDAQAALYALHHGLAKGALFLSVGLLAACAGRWRSAGLCIVILVALSITGLPLSGGGLAKLAAKSALDPVAETALTLTAITTTVVLAWFVVRLAAAEPHAGAGRPDPRLALPTLAAAVGALIAPWALWSGWSDLPPDYPWHLSSLKAGLWPVLVGLALAGVAGLVGWRAPALPSGDVEAPMRARLHRAAGTFAGPAGRARTVRGRVLAAGARLLARGIALGPRLERELSRGRAGGTLLAVLAGTLVLLAAV